MAEGNVAARNPVDDTPSNACDALGSRSRARPRAAAPDYATIPGVSQRQRWAAAPSPKMGVYHCSVPRKARVRVGQQGNNSSYVWKYQYRTAMKSSIYHINHSVRTDVLYFASRPPHTPHTPKRWLSTLLCHGIPDQVGEVSILVVNKCGDTVFNAMLPREVHCDQSRAAKLPTVRYVS